MEIVDAAAFLRGARGMVLGPQWIYGSPDARLYFSVLFGAVDETHVDGLIALWAAELATAGHVSLCDTAALESATPGAFAALNRFLKDHRDTLARTIERQAIVLGSSLTGTMAAGFYRVFPPPYEYRLCDSRDEALGWLDCAADALAAVDAHRDGEPLVRAVRAALADDCRLEVEIMARTLGVSTRSLQRRLEDAGTSFRKEARRAQIARAMTLLLTTDQKLAAIASAIGCASVVTFSELFAREVGMPPGAWRTKQRG